MNSLSVTDDSKHYLNRLVLILNKEFKRTFSSFMGISALFPIIKMTNSFPR